MVRKVAEENVTVLMETSSESSSLHRGNRCKNKNQESYHDIMSNKERNSCTFKKAVVAVKETSIMQLQPYRHQNMPSQVGKHRNSKLYLS